MNFLRYNSSTGAITSLGYMDQEHIQAEIDNGLPTLHLDKEIDDQNWIVNLETKQIEPK